MRFIIRDMFWLTVVVAMTVAWWSERRQFQKLSSELSSIKSSVRDLRMEKHFEFYSMLRDPAREPAIRRALTTVNSNPENWTDEEMGQFLELVKANRPFNPR